MTCHSATTKPLPKSWRPASRAMTVALMLCCGGCANMPLTSVHQGPLGNAVLATLPAGTRLEIPGAESERQLEAAFVNEVRSSRLNAQSPKPTTNLELGAWNLELRTPLKLCTPAYLAERDLREMELLKQIEILRIENQTLRLK